MKLSQWAKNRGIPYKTAWRWVKEGKKKERLTMTWCAT
ncbi:MAG: hypothetical protein HSCHL_0468 [Hydrogenibacillus schlegelii]|uniref:IS607 family transposase n=1 Tax=Hydrogenibacillus schlegelii TaxID=1484 RepID=A0A2T5G840_HYDSH|nr:MAG: hypothetical protein HSCHL_0468 [Hydrogenibacillus schlegelii]